MTRPGGSSGVGVWEFGLLTWGFPLYQKEEKCWWLLSNLNNPYWNVFLQS